LTQFGSAHPAGINAVFCRRLGAQRQVRHRSWRL